MTGGIMPQKSKIDLEAIAKQVIGEVGSKSKAPRNDHLNFVKIYERLITLMPFWVV
jgi:hypothetical protein